MRLAATVLLLLSALALTLPASARDPYGVAGRYVNSRHHDGSAYRGSSPHRPTGSTATRQRAWSQTERLRERTELRKAEAGIRLLQQRRTLERRTTAEALALTGTPTQVRAHRLRVENQDRADDLRIRQRLRDVDPDWWASLGPDTRYVLESSGVFVRRAEQRREQRRELDDLERIAGEREPPPSW